MSMILIDRRKAGKGKSSPNRQKLIKRIKSFIKTSAPQNIGQGGVSGGKSAAVSPVKVAGSALEEPWFAYANNGEHTAVVIGNTEYERGDEVDIPDSEEQQGGAGQGDNGEDDFIVNIARDEFLDLFYEDCELPNLTNEKFTEKLDNTFQPAGFSPNGVPSQLSVIRTYKQSIGRRRALMGPYREEKEALEAELAQLKEFWPITIANGKLAEAEIRVAEIEIRLAEIAAKFKFFDGFDKSDLRYRKKEAKPLKTVDAVLIMLMDVSGSMDEGRKTIGRRWFALLYAFIKRRYTNTELVFVAHTTEAFELSEDDFFSTRMNGGTEVSPALKMINNIIKERYDVTQTNIYVSHASDGDNWSVDDAKVVDEMSGTGHLINKIQLFSYVEVGHQSSGHQTWINGANSDNDTNLWEAYSRARDNGNQKKMTLSIIETADDCFNVFKKVFKKK